MSVISNLFLVKCVTFLNRSVGKPGRCSTYSKKKCIKNQPVETFLFPLVPRWLTTRRMSLTCSGWSSQTWPQKNWSLSPGIWFFTSRGLLMREMSAQRYLDFSLFYIVLMWSSTCRLSSLCCLVCLFFKLGFYFFYTFELHLWKSVESFFFIHI